MCVAWCNANICPVAFSSIAYTLIDGEGEGFKSDPLVSSIFDAETTLSTLSLEFIDEDPEDAEDESLDLRNILVNKHSQNIRKII